ncbi:MAG: aldo/keto reductase [Saprospiraceae bacterium]|nr:aldo/keto reductase [Saprospiraceae bacterium]
MLYETLNDTDLKVSKICLGTMTWGEQNSEAEAHAQLDYAINAGINFIDTAEMYAVPPRPKTQGLTEKYIGTWLKKRGKRGDLIIASKIAGPRADITWVRQPMDFTSASLEQAANDSLTRLQTDYLDLYQLHWPERNTNFFGKLGYRHQADERWEDNFRSILESVNQLIKSGKIRHFGLSNETPWATMRFLEEAKNHKLPKIISVQNPYNLLNRSYEVGLAEISMRENVGCLPYSPLAFGLLSGKYHRKEDKPENRINQFKGLSRYNSASAWEATERYLAIADKYGISLTRLSLAFINAQPFVTSNIIGATDLEQLEENISSINVEFTSEMLEDINEVHAAISNPSP